MDVVRNHAETVRGYEKNKHLFRKTWWDETGLHSRVETEKKYLWGTNRGARTWEGLPWIDKNGMKLLSKQGPTKGVNVWKTKMLIVNVHTDKWLDCDLQRTDPASRQRGRPTHTGQQIPDPNSWKGSNIWSNVHKVGSTQDILSAVKWLSLWLWKFSSVDSRQLKQGGYSESEVELQLWS
jgi:hypothetical protein